ncbi:papain-like cysteine protease family protein [Streptomyces sp. NPDC091212]|uniref:papain-like cysteine protease family protein n=1 Tax=Streptomyces sp. NPDC091212 TaxID=3155191 RepID=UPI00343A45FF
MGRFRCRPAASAIVLAAAGLLAATGGTAHAEAGQDNIGMYKQEKTQWCWVASGLTIAKFQGFGSTQTDFCNRAQPYYGCDNQPATLGDMARGWNSLGMRNPGSGLDSAATFDQVYNEVKAARPIGTRIGWTSGGGHMNVVYGFDTSRETIAVADPWPDTATYTWWNYSDYVSNSSSKWTHSRIGISG